MHGILLLDKPSGVRSNAVLQRVKWLYHARKAGHTGALDNLASGMLPICLGEATKLSQFLLDADKRYRSVFTLGVTTSTGDAEGEVRSRTDCSQMSVDRVREVLARFVGDIEQVPPMHSALKRQGRRLYELAYAGEEVERAPRPVTIYSLQLIDATVPEITVEVCCSKGTYIRTLAEDVGEALGCGAHVSVLRRLAVAPFDDAVMFTLDEVEAAAEQDLHALDALLLPIDRAVSALPSIELDPRSAFYLRQGQPVLSPHAPDPGLVRVYAEAAFVGIGEVLEDGRVAPRRLLQTA